MAPYSLDLRKRAARAWDREPDAETTVAAIGPVTAAAATELGIRTTTIVPLSYTVEGLLAALVDHFKTPR
jgi:uroporphyrinogen-III synthase